MSVDVDAVNERLNGLVTLLQAVGVSDPHDVDRVTQKLGGGGKAGQLNDEQIEAILRKLQKVQAEAPQIMAALEAHAEAKSIGGRKQNEEEEEDDDEDEDEEYDEDGNYPMVGHGVSDDISIVSDLTTPTVVSSIHVPEEEHYRDSLPPMIVGGPGHSMMIQAPKRKNLVTQVRPGALAPPGRRNTAAVTPKGGAAAKRKQKYQDTMARLQQEPPTPTAPEKPKVRTSRRASMSGSIPTSKAVGSSVSSLSGDKKIKKKVKPREAENFSDFASARADDDWNAGFNGFENKATRSKNAATTVIDDDGFLVGESFDPFASSGPSNPFKKSPAGDLEFGFSSNASAAGFDELAGKSRKPRKSSGGTSSKPMASNFSEQSERKTSRGHTSSSGTGTKPRRSRRASLAM